MAPAAANQNNQDNRPSKGKFTGPCFHCQTPRHRAVYCPGVTFKSCGQQGHSKKVCPHNTQQQPQANPQEPYKQCVGCHAQGVLLWTCPKCAPVLQALGNGLAGPLAGQQQSQM
ncbi:hypothetical protein TKK_0005557 [Trichogramma kaykai]|uniref:CCHC-type domain-containing protein n=1 Tax=Trichogramma kaykai TaxID=54128 RepID=A0ABD2XHB7_9HYME